MSRGQCLECKDIIESKHRYDFVKCKCGKSFIDGGDDYLRGGGYLLPVLDALDEDMFDDQGYLDDDFDDYNLGFQAGVMDERERIIKLLESKLCPCVESDAIPSPDDDREEIMKHMNCSWDAMMIEYHVALIKGEQK